MSNNTWPGAGNPASFAAQVSFGRIPGIRPEFVIGVNTNAANNVEELVWDGDGLRSPIPAPQLIFVSSTSVADNTGAVVLIVALDENYNRIFLTAALNGQTQVQAVNVQGGSNLVVWVQSAVVQTVGAVGDVYVALTSALTAGVPNDSAAIQARIIAGNNVTRIAAFMVPEGKAAVVTAIRGGTDAASKTAQVHTKIAQFGQPTVEPVEYEITSAWAGLQFPFFVGVTELLDGVSAPSLPARTMLQYTATANTSGTRVFFGFDLLVVDAGFMGTEG